MKLPVIALLMLLTVSCGGLAQQNKSDYQLEGLTNSEVMVSSSSTQDAIQTKGANVRTDSVETILTTNSTGIKPVWFILGALVFGMVIPQPKFIKVIF